MTKTTKNQPTPANESDIVAESSEPTTVVPMPDRNQERLNALAVIGARETETSQNKTEILAAADAAIEKVVKLAGDKSASEDADRRVTEAADSAASILFKGRISGLLSPDEVSELLGRGFGFKTKADGKPSKTPFGAGERIRKRVVRAFDAVQFVRGTDEPKAFFEPLSKEDVKPLVNSVLKGERSVFTLYDDLGALKQKASGSRLPTAFNPKAIANLQALLGENVRVSVQTWHDTPGLLEAYVGLYQTITLISEEYWLVYADEIKAA